MSGPLTAIYLRQSLDKQEGIDRQRERCSQLVSARAWHLVDEYVDNDLSASKPRGPGTAWHRMLGDLGTQTITHVVAVDLDRLLRTTRDLNVLIDAGAKVLTVDGEIDLSTADGEFRATMLAGIGRFEAQRKGERQKRANADRLERGVLFKGGVRLTGYTQGGEVIEDEATIVRSIFTDFVRGETLKGIARSLTESSAQPRRKTTTLGHANAAAPDAGTWSPSSVRSILTNPRYAGRAVMGGKATGVTGEWVAIIESHDFDLVQARLSEPGRKRNMGTTARKYLGSGLWQCGICSAPMTSTGRRYWCRAGGHVARTAEHVDSYIEGIILRRLARPDLLSAFRPTDDLAARRLSTEVAKLTAKLELVDSDYYNDLVPAAVYAEKRRRILIELGDVEAERARGLSEGSVASILGSEPARSWSEATIDRRRAIAHALMTVRLHPAPVGRKGFDPETVEVVWNGTGH
ncbi:recombinase family protein [Frigoribacterium sp. PhB116]|uniref:recombinase family protein n=1 Tax=Frigoribacterium sp. PhB116 TaxID=2485174 RepID=UPI00105B7874|nr:recombinase family protein [Frigoribacterium sp. PhB116]TDT64441.1 DNA invertase Pin-like site-specific DNA recombinase [Frigoribacterium sp. PhB116]